MIIPMRLLSLVLIVCALLLLGADVVSSLEKGGEISVRSLDTVWAALDKSSLDAFKAWVQNRAPSLAQMIYSFLALPGWAASGVIGVVLAFIFGRKHGPE